MLQSISYKLTILIARCTNYLCPDTLACVHFPHHCPCPFPAVEDKVELADGSMLCVSKGGYKPGEAVRKVELARKGLLWRGNLRRMGLHTPSSIRTFHNTGAPEIWIASRCVCRYIIWSHTYANQHLAKLSYRYQSLGTAMQSATPDTLWNKLLGKSGGSNHTQHGDSTWRTPEHGRGGVEGIMSSRTSGLDVAHAPRRQQA